jgi:hypothetical protein
VENTFAAYQAALQLGADGLEIDLRRTRDGVLVLFNHDMPDRLTDGFGALNELSFAALRYLRFKPDVVPRNAPPGGTVGGWARRGARGRRPRVRPRPGARGGPGAGEATGWAAIAAGRPVAGPIQAGRASTGDPRAGCGGPEAQRVLVLGSVTGSCVTNVVLSEVAVCLLLQLMQQSSSNGVRGDGPHQSPELPREGEREEEKKTHAPGCLSHSYCRPPYTLPSIG